MIKRRIRNLILIFLSLLAFACLDIHASETLLSINAMDISKLHTVLEVEAAVRRLNAAVVSLDQSNQLTFDIQKAVLNKFGECISKLAAINNEKQGGQGKMQSFSLIRNTVKQIILKNEKIILFYQENKLDGMEDPTAFFKSSEWQNPQYLISLASYWLGWNGYYGSMQLHENDALQKVYLEEAIKGYSRAFIDFEEEDVILRSLLGRALCHSKVKEYERAKKDLSAVKRRLKKDHPLYVRCLYEENRILYATGNLEMALRNLEEIHEDYSPEKIPPELAVGFDQLKAKILVGLLEKTQPEGKATPGDTDAQTNRIFLGLKRLAEQPGGVNEFYKYVRDHSARLSKLSFSDLGPVGALGIGDANFENKNYDMSLQYYLPLSSQAPKILTEKMDGIRFRIGYIYSRNENWQEAISFLKDFHKRFPNSYLMEQAIPLYYAAASNNYKRNPDQQAYREFLDAARVYATRCRGKCPDLSEAHFQVGQYYEKIGKTQDAVKEFLYVGDDSPNAPIAKYYLLRHYLERLEDLRNTGRIPSDESDRIYRESIGVVKKYQAMSEKKIQTDFIKRIHPHMIVLQADLLTFDTTRRDAEILSRIKDFEKKYPKEKQLFPKIFQLRASSYFNLDQRENLKSEMEGFTSAPHLDKSRYDAVRDLANYFYYHAEDSRNKQFMDAADKNTQAALMAYENLYRLSCDHDEFKNNCDAIQLRMAKIYIDNDRLDQAETIYKDILKRNSLSADAYYGLGMLYEKKEQWKDALAIWRKFSDGVKDGTYHWYESRYKTARAHEKLGNTKKACEILTITTVLHPDLGNDELSEKFQKLISEVCKETL